ncbi:ER membrane glycoprotein subunit of the GPI transamidase complex-like protein [Allomyces javanicus]|nr:ER membrane glycoprotein subunit of the GPI transamidase complex-like protein [Allomyces javanicus]
MAGRPGRGSLDPRVDRCHDHDADHRVVGPLLRHALWWSTAARVGTVVVATVAAAFAPNFDDSTSTTLGIARPDLHGLALHARVPLALIKWDAIHLLGIAHDNLAYRHDHALAFFPAMPWLARVVARYVLNPLFGTRTGTDAGVNDQRLLLAWGGIVVANLAFLAASAALFGLVCAVTKRPHRAFLAAVLFACQPASVFMSSFYTESVFAFLGFSGMWAMEQSHWALAALLWALSTLVRSNGILHAGFFAYHFLFVKPRIRLILYAAVVFAPFLWWQWMSWHRFCTPTTAAYTPPTWCATRPLDVPTFGTLHLPAHGLPYTAVQTQYWHVGWLRYWSLAQLPNFAIAAPVLVHSVVQIVNARDWPVPYRVLHAFCVFYGLTSMHVQVVVRMFSCLPLMFVTESRRWVQYSVLWATVGAVLFGLFYPPA